MMESEAVVILHALSHEIRVKATRFLVSRDDEAASAGEIGTSVNAAPSKISLHLAKLENAKIINFQRKARKIIYRANFENIGDLVPY